MKARKFNSIMPRVNEVWAAKVLNMELNGTFGPDLVDDKKIVEVKFFLVDLEEKYSKAWTVLEHQMNYGSNKQAFWALGSYRLSSPVSSIRTGSIDSLENLVQERELYIVSWNWMNQYIPSNTRGRTERSAWENTFRYPKLRDVPPVRKTFSVEKGKVHLTDDAQETLFNINYIV